MRLFFAAHLPAPVRAALVAAQEDLRARLGDAVRWTRPEALHLTLKFLGEVDGARAPETLLAAAAEGLSPGGPLDLVVQGLGAFGGRRPRVVWAGVEGPDLEGLRRLAEHLDGALRPLGFPGDGRPYAPHITLGRVRTPGRGLRHPAVTGDALVSAVDATALGPVPLRIEELLLESSSFGSARGPVRYRTEGRLPLDLA